LPQPFHHPVGVGIVGKSFVETPLVFQDVSRASETFLGQVGGEDSIHGGFPCVEGLGHRSVAHEGKEARRLRPADAQRRNHLGLAQIQQPTGRRGGGKGAYGSRGMESAVEVRGVAPGAHPAEDFITGDDGGNNLLSPFFFLFGQGQDRRDSRYPGVSQGIPVSVVQFQGMSHDPVGQGCFQDPNLSLSGDQGGFLLLA
jgi:hypothetical protein